MPELNGTETHANLRAAFASASQANQRYLWFAQKADVEGYPAAAAIFRSVASGKSAHASDHLEWLADVGDPVTEQTIGDTDDNLAAALAGETVEGQAMFPNFAMTARQEGFVDIAEWFDTLIRADQSHVERFTQGRRELS